MRTVLNDRVDIAAIYIEADCMNLSLGIGGALKVAAATDRLDFVRLLHTKCMPHDVGSVLVAAVEHGHWDIVPLVYERCDQYAVGSALGKAASSCRWDVVETLYERCEEGCRHVRDALEHAVASGELEMVKLLHRKCTQYDIENALYAAMDHNRWDMVEVLYAKCRAFTTGRALEKAASQARWELVKLMYDNGARLGGYAVGDVLAEAASIGRWDVVQHLQDKAKGYGVSRALSKAVASEELSIVELLCAKCNLLDVANTMDEAAMDSRWCVVQVLVKAYAEKIAATTGKVYLERVLERAAAEGQLGIVKLLYDKCDSSCYIGARATPEVREFLAANCAGYCAMESQPVEATFYMDDFATDSDGADAKISCEVTEDSCLAQVIKRLQGMDYGN